MRLLVPAVSCVGVAALALSAGLRATPLAQPPGSIRFDEIAARSGLGFTHEYSPTAEKHLIESVPGGVAVFDADNDGRLDVFFTNGATSPGLVKSGERFANRLFHNDGDGRFTDITARAGVDGVGYAMGVGAADFDNDGRVDLFVTGVDRHQLLRNLGDGRFEDVTARTGIRQGEWAAAAGWLDFDRDGRLDLFLANYLRWTPAFDRYCGDDARRIRVYCHPRYFEGMANRLYRNKGDGVFEDVTTASGIGRHVGKGMSVAMLDVDRDGWTDIFVTNDAVPNFLFRNKGDGTFDETALLAGVAVPAHGRAVSSMGVDAQDYDRDGAADVAVTALTGETFPLFRGDGRGGFLEATHTSGLAVLSARRSGWCAAFLDADNDGWLDLFTSNSHVNDRIDAFESTTWKTRTSSTSIGYASSVHAPLHFGLGVQTKIDRIEVVWPSGTTQIVESPQIDRVVTITEAAPGA
jgi:hypothetical protein